MVGTLFHYGCSKRTNTLADTACDEKQNRVRHKDILYRLQTLALSPPLPLELIPAQINNGKHGLRCQLSVPFWIQPMPNTLAQLQRLFTATVTSYSHKHYENGFQMCYGSVCKALPHQGIVIRWISLNACALLSR